jgi:A/G-specific adenine glycosylase
MMELGETVCTPKSPNCEACPVRKFCEAWKRGIVDEIPAPRRKPATVHQRIAAAVLLDPQGRTLLVRDPGTHDSVLFSRLWQFPAVQTATNGGTELAQQLRKRYGVASPVLTALPPAKHAVTFRNIMLAPFLARVEKLPKLSRTRTLPLSHLSSIPISSATRKIATAALRALETSVADSGKPRNGGSAQMLK